MRARWPFVFFVLGLAPCAWADEGQWPPDQLGALDQAELALRGLRLDPEELWGDPQSLMRAVINYGGCSAAFVSKDGLIATNHHCAHAAIRALSSVEHNYLRDGFLAKTRADERLAKGRNTITLPRSIEDVTTQVLAAAKGVDDDLERYKAIDRKKREIALACEAQQPHLRCEVHSFYGGGEFKLHTALQLTDVRLVYAPPASVGAFGGEIDNWMWPRHSGDFSLLRAYVSKDGAPAPYSKDNVPYHPERWLQLNPKGVATGDFVAVLGYPGRTDRYLPAVELRRRIEQVLPKTIALYSEWIRILRQASKADPAAKIKVAAQLSGLSNTRKNSRGMLVGIRRMDLLKRRSKEEARLGADAAPLLDALAKLSAERSAQFDVEFSLSNLANGPNLLANAIDLVRRAEHAKTPQLERPERYMDRNQARLLQTLEQKRSRAVPWAEARLMRSALAPLGQAMSLEDAQAMLAKTTLQEAAATQALFEAPAQIEQSADPLIVLARSIAPKIEAMELASKRRRGRALLHAPRYIERLRSVRGGPVYPDANGSLRLSYASVQGYLPKDGLRALPFTTVGGQLQKHTGEAPFALPQTVLQRGAKAPRTSWASDPLQDVPVCFLSNADTTGGNSGSPVIDGEGALVGLNFDRVWENIAGDLGYSKVRSRNIAVDVRYLLWTLDQIEDASNLLLELGVADLRGEKKAPPPARARTPPPAAHARSCQSFGAPSWALLLPALVLTVRSRQSARPRRSDPDAAQRRPAGPGPGARPRCRARSPDRSQPSSTPQRDLPGRSQGPRPS